MTIIDDGSLDYPHKGYFGIYVCSIIICSMKKEKMTNSNKVLVSYFPNNIVVFFKNYDTSV